jgi:hypothetical protein
VRRGCLLGSATVVGQMLRLERLLKHPSTTVAGCRQRHRPSPGSAMDRRHELVGMLMLMLALLLKLALLLE